MTVDDKNPSEAEIRDYTQLTQTIFPEELGSNHTPRSPEDAGKQSPKTEIEHEIIALAHRIIREEKLVLPDGLNPVGLSRNLAIGSGYSRYPIIPLDSERKHALIWRSTEETSLAESLNRSGGKSKKHQLHTPTSCDDDLEPILPPTLTRDVIEWMNRLGMNLAARVPAINRGTGVDGSVDRDRDKEGGAGPPPDLGWKDVLAALNSDVQSGGEKGYVVQSNPTAFEVRLADDTRSFFRRRYRLNERIFRRVAQDQGNPASTRSDQDAISE
jgi:hypothetical protein